MFLLVAVIWKTHCMPEQCFVARARTPDRLGCRSASFFLWIYENKQLCPLWAHRNKLTVNCCICQGHWITLRVRMGTYHHSYRAVHSGLPAMPRKHLWMKTVSRLILMADGFCVVCLILEMNGEDGFIIGLLFDIVNLIDKMFREVLPFLVKAFLGTIIAGINWVFLVCLVQFVKLKLPSIGGKLVFGRQTRRPQPRNTV